MADIIDASSADPFENDSQQGTPTNDQQEPSESGGGSNEDNDDGSVVKDLLASTGIIDSSKIKFEDDNGQIVERNWKDLSKEEKVNILNSRNTGVTAEAYNQEESDLINAIRESKLSPSEYFTALRNQLAQEAYDNQPQTYEIEGYTDDELFVLDAISRYGEENVTDEQLETLLNNAKSDAELYKKTIESLREQYQQKEDDLKFQAQQEAAEREAVDFDNFSNTILDEIQSLDNVAGQPVELTVDDLNTLANFILTRDETGNSEFGKIMNDPKAFTQMALWALKGNDIMKEISGQIKTAYNKGLEDGKKGQSSLVINNQKPKDKSAQNSTDSAFALDVS